MNATVPATHEGLLEQQEAKRELTEPRLHVRLQLEAASGSNGHAHEPHKPKQQEGQERGTHDQHGNAHGVVVLDEVGSDGGKVKGRTLQQLQGEGDTEEHAREGYFEGVEVAWKLPWCVPEAINHDQPKRDHAGPGNRVQHFRDGVQRCGLRHKLGHHDHRVLPARHHHLRREEKRRDEMQAAPHQA